MIYVRSFMKGTGLAGVLVLGILFALAGLVVTHVFWGDIDAWLTTPITDAEADAFVRQLLMFASPALMVAGLVITLTFVGNPGSTIRRSDERLLAGMPCWYCKSTDHDSAGHWGPDKESPLNARSPVRPPDPGFLCDNKPAAHPAKHSRSRWVSRTELVLNRHGLRIRKTTAEERNHQ